MTEEDELRPDEFEVGLGIRGKSLDPDLITSALGLEPTRSFRDGEAYLSKTGQEMKRPWTVWRYSVHKRGIEIEWEPTLRKAVEVLSPLADRLAPYRADPLVRVAAFIHWQPGGGYGGYTVPADLIAVLAGLADEIDFYYS